MADFHGQVKQGIETAADKAKQATDRVAGAVNGGQLKDKAHDVKDKAQDVAGQAREGVRSALDTAGQYAGQVQDKAGEWADDAVHAAKKAGDRVGHWAEDAYESVSNVDVGDFGKEVTSLIRKHPVPALLIGFGVGLLVGRAVKA